MSKRKIMRPRGWRNCRVVDVIDGDTVYVDHRGEREKIRLYGVDAPEVDQDWGRAAKKFLSRWKDKLVNVRIVSFEGDYGRLICLLYGGEVCLNEELIRNGLAWVYRTYCRNSICKKWLEMEEQARNQKLGLWSRENPLPPWEYRKSGHNR